jgi:hypothetical protein
VEADFMSLRELPDMIYEAFFAEAEIIPYGLALEFRSVLHLHKEKVSVAVIQCQVSPLHFVSKFVCAEACQVLERMIKNSQLSFRLNIMSPASIVS